MTSRVTVGRGPALLIAARHGQTAWNRAGRFQGHADPPMDRTGRRQAACLAADLADLYAQGALGPEAPLVVSSDLRRAVSTASAVARELDVAFTADEGLREVDLGAWSGLTRAEAEQRYPGEFGQWAAGADVRRGGGETAEEAGSRVAARIKALLEGALAGPRPKAVVVVGHGTSLQAAMSILRDRRVVDFGGPAPHLENGGRMTADNMLAPRPEGAAPFL